MIPTGITRTVRRHSVGRATVAVLAIVGLGGCGDKPQRSDIDDRAMIVYPAATILGVEKWFDEQDGTSIDGDDLSHPAFLSATYTLAEPVTADELFEWAEQRLRDLGWTHSREEPSAWYFGHKVDDRTHAIELSLTIPAGREGIDFDAITQYTIAYRIF